MSSVPYILSSQTDLLKQSLESMASEVANSLATGYKNKRVAFSSMLFKNHRSHKGFEGSTYPSSQGVWRNPQPGSLQKTGDPYHVALKGAHFFEVADGTVTRDGHLLRNPEGLLTTVDGTPFLDVGSNPISLGSDVQSIRIQPDGTLYDQNNTFLAQLRIVNVGDFSALQEVGQNRYRSTTVTPAENPHVLQGYLEESNVSLPHVLVHVNEVKNSSSVSGSMLKGHYDSLHKMTSQILPTES